MFTRNDIRNIAIQIEHNGEQAYRSAARKFEDEQIRQMFNWMADEELRHAQWFKNLHMSDQTSAADEQIESMGRALLQEMMKNQNFSLEETRLSGVMDIPALVDLSLEFENDTVLFYEMLRTFIEDAAAVEQLEAIISEEQGHVRQLERLKTTYAERIKENDPKR